MRERVWLAINEEATEMLPVTFCAYSKPLTPQFFTIRQNLGRLDRCVQCRQPLRIDDQVTQVISNPALFPNCFLHTACIKTELTLVAEYLREEWQQAQQYAHWF